MTDGIWKGKAEVTVIRLPCIALAILKQHLEEALLLADIIAL